MRKRLNFYAALIKLQYYKVSLCPFENTQILRIVGKALQNFCSGIPFQPLVDAPEEVYSKDFQNK
jgi:hypothetical protein